MRVQKWTELNSFGKFGRNRGGMPGWPARLALQGFLLISLHTFVAFASDAVVVTPVENRLQTIARLQRAKAKNLTPSQPDRMERFLYRYVGDNPMNKYAGGIPGLHLRFGGLPSGGGFGLGMEYLRPDLAGGTTTFRVSGVGSTKQWYRIEAELEFPGLAERYLDLRLQGKRTDANSLDYYGPGADSKKSGRSNYRREENAFDVSLTFKPVRSYLNIGFIAGYQTLNVGPGASNDSISTEKQFSPDQAPGIDHQTYYVRSGPFLEIDSRDKPSDPHVGTHFLLSLMRFSDTLFHHYSFRQIDSCLEQYLPFFNKKRVIALRAQTVLNYPEGDNIVPFYMQPTLGGTSTLRGYRRYRFYDNDLFLVSSEYRWEVFTLMDAALFADAGKVFHRDGDFGAGSMETDAGFGFRFKSRSAVVFRIDTAFSHEGFGVWATFDHAF
jgi:outer membrane protein assembly factor BamA